MVSAEGIAEGINSQDGTAESLQYIPVLFEVVCAEGINSAGDSTGKSPALLEPEGVIDCTLKYFWHSVL